MAQRSRAHVRATGGAREGPGRLDWYATLFEVIDMRSFSNLWYWIGVAVVWSSVSHFVIGVPFDMLQRARRYGGQADQDFEDMVRIYVNRIALINRLSGLWLVLFGSAAISALALLGFYYGIEFAQALFLIGFPLCIVAALSFRTAARIGRENPTGDALKKILVRHRFWCQMIGIFALTITAFWGMYQNLAVGALRGL